MENENPHLMGRDLNYNIVLHVEIMTHQIGFFSTALFRSEAYLLKTRSDLSDVPNIQNGVEHS